MKRWIVTGTATGVALAVALAVFVAFGPPKVRDYLRRPPGPRDDSTEAEEYARNSPLKRPLAGPAPRLRLVTWDFGTATPGKELKHRVELANSGDEPWTLKHFTPTCACTIGNLPSNAVKPGETTWMEVSYRAPLQDGRTVSPVMIEFAEPSSPIIQLMIQGEVRSLLSADPKSLEFEYAPADARPSQTVTLRNLSDQRVTLTRVQTPDWLRSEVKAEADAEHDGKPRQTWKLVLRVEPDKLPSTPAPAVVQVRTDTEDVGPAAVAVSVKPALEATPQQLAFAFEPGKPITRQVLLRASAALGELSEKDVEVSHGLGDELEVRVQKESAPHLLKLDVRFQAKPKRLVLEDDLEIRFKKAAVPPVKVRLTGSLIPPKPPGGKQ